MSIHAASLVGLAYTVTLLILGLKLHVMGDGGAEADFLGAYVRHARSFLDGKLPVYPYHGPVYPIVLGWSYSLLETFGVGFFEAGIVLSAVSAGFFLFLTFKVVENLFSFRAAATVVGLLAVNPIFVRYSYTTGNDMFFAAIATVAVYLFLRRDVPGWPRLVALGVMSGVAYLTRYNGITLLVTMVVGVTLANLWRTPWRGRFIACLVIVAAFIVTVTPWGLYCKSETGQFFYNKGYENVAYGFYVDDGRADRFQAEHGDEINSLIDVVAFDPGRFFGALPGRAIGHLWQTADNVLGWPSAVFVLLGLVPLVLRRIRRRQVVYYLFAVTAAGLLMLVFFGERFVLFLIPIYLAAAADGLCWLCGLIKRRSWSRWAYLALAAMLIAQSAFACIVYNKRYIRGGSYAFRQLGEWFATKMPATERGKTVAARKPYFGYFAGLNTVDIPIVGSYEELLGALHARNIDYLFFSVVAEQMREELAFLARIRKPEQSPPGLRLLAASSAGSLYRVEK